MTTVCGASLASSSYIFETDFLAALLKEMDVCSTIEEAEAIADVIVCECDGDGSSVNLANPNYITERLLENADIDRIQANKIVSQLQKRTRSEVISDENSSSSDIDNNIQSQSSLVVNEGNTDYSDGDDDGVLLDNGECELCDRFIRLTRHHLIPRSTWPRIQQRLLVAAAWKEGGEEEKARTALGNGLVDRMERLRSDKGTIQKLLHETCDICRPCHTTVHKTHINLDLALFHNTVAKLLEDEKISKFCKWASKQKTGKYAV
jgi:hypothetical protein